GGRPRMLLAFRPRLLPTEVPVAVWVDASGDHQAAGGVDHLARIVSERARRLDRRDLLAADPDVERFGARRRDDRAAANDEVVAHGSSFQTAGGSPAWTSLRAGTTLARAPPTQSLPS